MKKYILFIFFSLLLLAIPLFSDKAAVYAQKAPREIDANDINVPDGYKIEPVVANLSVPTTAIFDGDDLLIAESGYKDTAKPRVLLVSKNGDVEILAGEGLQEPVTGLLVIDKQIYVSHKGKVSIIEGNGKLRDIVTGLPSDGDHQNNNIVLGRDGKIYMGQGTTTNSGVVGVDSYLFGWLPKYPQLHGTPCKDITLNGINFESENPLTEADDKVTTGAYKSLGTLSKDGEVIKGNPKCGGSIVRFNPDGSDFELVAWGLRNPFGLEFDKNGQLWSTSHGVDERGSRPIFNDPDYLFQIEEGAWYGWPEFFDGEPVTANRFQQPGKPQPQFLWKDHPPLTRPFTTFDSHEASNGITISPGGNFGFDGDAFVAMYGTFTPLTAQVNLKPAGFQVVRVDLQNGQVHDFADNTLPGPYYINQQGGFARPSDVLFGPDNSLYVVDWGAATLDEEGLKLQPQTGVIWRIYSAEQTTMRPNGPILVEAESIPTEDRKPLAPNVPELYKALTPTFVIVGVVLLLVIVVILFIVRRLRRH
jgi:glucose/arabinose dehydrogenase